MLAFGLILATITAGYFGAPWWVALACASGLALSSAAEVLPYRARLLAVGGADVLLQTRLASLSAACLAAGAAFVTGRALGWLLAHFENYLRAVL